MIKQCENFKKELQQLLDKYYMADMTCTPQTFTKFDKEYWVGKRCYTINGISISSFIFTGSLFDIEQLEAGNAFETRAEAETELERRKARQRLKKAIAEFNGDWKPDWNTLDKKFYLDYPEGVRSIQVGSNYHNISRPTWLCLKEHPRREWIETIEKDYKTYMGIEQ